MNTKSRVFDDEPYEWWTVAWLHRIWGSPCSAEDVSGSSWRDECDLVEIPVALLRVIRVDEIVQPRILEELLQRRALRAAALHVGDEAIGERHFPAREEAAVALRAAQNAVDAGNRLARQPLGLKRRIVHERIAEPPRRLIREHIKVAALIRAGCPP